MGAPSGHGQRNKKHNTGRHASKNTRAKHKTGVEDGGHRRTVKVRALAAAAAAHDFRPFASVPAPRPSCGRVASLSFRAFFLMTPLFRPFLQSSPCADGRRRREQG